MKFRLAHSHFVSKVILLWSATYFLLLSWDGYTFELADSRFSFCLTFILLVSMVLYASVGSARTQTPLKLSGLYTIIGIGLLAGLMAIPIETVIQSWLAGGILLIVATILGAALGGEIEERHHLWPLIIVAVCFDLWSVTAPDGVSQRLVADETSGAAISFLTLSLPVPGLGIQPLLGVGDVVFSAFLFGACHRLNLSYKTAILGQGVGYGLCLITLLILALPIPALAFVAPALGLSFGRKIQPRLKETLGAFLFVALAFGLKTVLV